MGDATEEARKQAIEKMQAARQEVAAGENDKPAAESKAKDEVSLPDEAGGINKTKKVAVKKKIDSDGTTSAKLSKVKIYSAFHVYFDGPAFSVSAENGTGPFDVLPGHKNFLSLLKPCMLVVRSSIGEEAMEIERGVLHVRDDEVTVFLDV